ncbi:MAG: response regulator transcription factor [Chloroflexi bacterium]|nr:response regulator transcription factor [Chloroflexota bacterium]
MPSPTPLATTAPMVTLESRTAAATGGGPLSSFTPVTRSPRRLVVGIVAAYPSMRAGLGALVQSDRNLTASAVAPQALAAASGMPALSQISDADAILIAPADLDQETLANLTALSHDVGVPLVWLGPEGLPEHARRGRVAGGVIARDAGAETVVAAIHAVHQGLHVVDPEVAQVDLSSGPSGQFEEASSTLSPREREVLTLVASGLPNKAIARSLGISDHTVKFHVSSVLAKLGAASRTEAVTIATRLGILSL